MRIPVVERLLATVGYLPFLPFWLLPVMGKRDSMFCQFHGRQAGVLWGLWFVPSLLIFAVMFFLPSTTENNLQQQLSPYFFGTVAVLTIVYLLMCFVGLVKALVRERYRMPVVADVALLLRL